MEEVAMKKQAQVPVIDLSGVKRIYVAPFVIGGGRSGETVDDATITAMIYDDESPDGRVHKGTLRITKPALEELTFRLMSMMGFHVSNIEFKRS